jgi:hypothetical protein
MIKLTSQTSERRIARFILESLPVAAGGRLITSYLFLFAFFARRDLSLAALFL